MEIIGLILIALIAALLWHIKFAPRFLSAHLNDWLVLEWHKFRDVNDITKRAWDSESPMHIQFIPIIGWEYDRWGYKDGRPTPITPPAYRVQSRIDNTTEYDTLSYWIRDGAVCDISDYWSHAGDLWENLSEYTIAGAKIEVHGSVPDCCRKRLFDIIALSEQQQAQENT